MISKFVLGFTIIFLLHFNANACECPLSKLDRAECEKYEIIFKGKITAVTLNKDKLSEAIFEVGELYKGNALKLFKVLFDDQEACAQTLVAGQEWIIYGRYKQIDNIQMDWCSRSRKHFALNEEDFYSVTYGNDYDDEVKFLKQNLGIHRVLAGNEYSGGGRNILPTLSQSIIILVSSVLVLLLFYYLFNKFFK
ncbi:MAG: hypothetical protein WCR21_06815 [Bacteroidota bacterium]